MDKSNLAGLVAAVLLAAVAGGEWRTGGARAEERPAAQETKAEVKEADPGKLPAEVEKALAREFSVDFVDQPFEECLKYLQGLSNINFELHIGDAVRQKLLRLQLAKIPLDTALDWVLQLGGCKREYRNGAIHILPRKAGEPDPALFSDKEKESIKKKLAEWEDPPKLGAEDQAAVKKLIADLGSKEFAEREAATKTLVAKGAAVKPYVEAMLKSGDLEVVARGQIVLEGIKPSAPLRYEAFVKEFEKKGAKEIKFDFDRAQVDGALDFLERCSGINMFIDPACGVGDKRVTLRADKTTVKAALDDILKLAGLRREFGKGAIYITKAPAEIRTKILDVRTNSLFALGAGSDGGVKEGMIFLISRGGENIGKVRVTTVDKEFSAGEKIEWKMPFKPGDDAVSDPADKERVLKEKKEELERERLEKGPPAAPVKPAPPPAPPAEKP